MTKLSQDKKPLVIIFLTVFIYLLGFGIVIPSIPLLSVQLGATAFETGLLMSAYSFMQFIFSPFWGRLSDKYGRRPILLFCLAGEAVSYLLFAQAQSLGFLFFARLLSGFFGASISTASAYISDITPANERSKGMALIGAAFGLGFLFGPAIGGALTIWAEHISTDPFFRTSFSSYWVAGLCAVTFFFALQFLKESRQFGISKAAEQPLHKRLIHYFKVDTVGPLMFVFMLSSLAMSTMEATLILYTKDKFGWGLKEVSFGFAYIGVIIVITQGYLVRRLIPKLGEKHVLRAGLTFMTIGFSGIVISDSIWILAVAQTFLAVGVGFTNPSTLGSISLLTNADEQGTVLGTTQGMSSLGRIIGPAVGGALYSALTIQSPFILSGAMALLGLFVVITIFGEIPNAGQIVKQKTEAESQPDVK
ncbi:MAG: multidrug resistance protein [Pseudobdellovibrio sp.]|jgi:MFS family permease|nr:multidrug resistance protein [Pseudobdellovibrio sp.]